MIQGPPAVYNRELFVKSDKNFECSICRNMQKDPVLCKKGHGYCRSCIEALKTQSAWCPSCYEALDVLVPNRDAERIISKSLIYCYTRLPELLNQETVGDAAQETEDPTSTSGCQNVEGPKDDGQVAVVDHCTWTGLLKDADDHFRVCDYAGVACSLGCGVVVARKDKTEHEAACNPTEMACQWEGCDVKMRSAALALHELECPQRAVTCSNAGCGSEDLTRDRLAAHVACCEFEEVACPFAAQGCTARMLRKDVDSHEESVMRQHLRLLAVKRVDDQQQVIDRHQQAIEELRQAHESLKHHVMPLNELIVFRVKYDELTGTVPFVPRFVSWPTRLYSERRVVRGYQTRLFVQTNATSPEHGDYGVYLSISGGPFPCKVQYTFELVHHDGNPLSGVKWTRTNKYIVTSNRGHPHFISKVRLASPNNNPYVKDGYVTFKCTFKFV